MNRQVKDHEILAAVFAKMDVPALSVAVGLLCSFVLVLATGILLLQEVPANSPVGPHLSALAEYLPGYTVSWGGALIGGLYGFLAGAFLGFFCAVYWNLAHYFALGVMLVRSVELVD